MSDLLVGALGVLLATNQPAALSNLVAQKTGLIIPVVNTNDPVELELFQLMEADEAAQEEVQRWLDEGEKPKDELTAPSALSLKARIGQRFDKVKVSYEEFLRRNPGSAKGRLAYGSFLNDIGDEFGAITQWERSRELDPKNPAVWNNLANTYAHVGPVEKSFPYYDEALRLNPNVSVYWHNFGTLTFLFRGDATNYFKTDEQGVFTRALDMYQRAIQLDPHNFTLLTDVAQTFYGVKLPPTKTPEETRQAEIKLADTALGAWTNALSHATSDEDREGVFVHMARWNLRVRRLETVRANLDAVTNEVHAVMRQRLERNLRERTEAKESPSPAR